MTFNQKMAEVLRKFYGIQKKDSYRVVTLARTPAQLHDNYQILFFNQHHEVAYTRNVDNFGEFLKIPGVLELKTRLSPGNSIYWVPAGNDGIRIATESYPGILDHEYDEESDAWQIIWDDDTDTAGSYWPSREIFHQEFLEYFL